MTPAAAAAAKSLQSCPTLCDPIDGSPPGSSVPGVLQARTLEWVKSWLVVNILSISVIIFKIKLIIELYHIKRIKKRIKTI